jgi:predicted lipoprotein with Yx(FWY)xxD motif
VSLRLVGLVAALALSACEAPASDVAESAGSDAPSATSTPATPTTPESDPSPTESSGPPGTRVIVDDSEFGPMLYSAKGQAIYLFDLEDGPRPRCYDECAEAWPPVLTTGDPVAGRGVHAGLLGTVQREGGATQVTYAGHPLYFYGHEGLWQVLCHDFEDFGGTWFVVQRDGAAAP